MINDPTITVGIPDHHWGTKLACSLAWPEDLQKIQAINVFSYTCAFPAVKGFYV